MTFFPSILLNYNLCSIKCPLFKYTVWCLVRWLQLDVYIKIENTSITSESSLVFLCSESHTPLALTDLVFISSFKTSCESNLILWASIYYICLISFAWHVFEFVHIACIRDLFFLISIPLYHVRGIFMKVETPLVKYIAWCLACSKC